MFVSVGGAGLIANLTKNIVGRARPELYDSVGPLAFKPFAFDADWASFPSGHATNMFAFATVIGMLWPKGRVLLYTLAAWIAASRVLIGEHYFTDVVAGAHAAAGVPPRDLAGLERIAVRVTDRAVRTGSRPGEDLRRQRRECDTLAPRRVPRCIAARLARPVAGGAGVRVSSLAFAQTAWLSGIHPATERLSERERTLILAILATLHRRSD